MMRHFDLMRLLIQRVAPGVSFSFSYDTVPGECGSDAPYMVVVCESRNFSLSVLADSVWTDVKRVLTKKLARHEDEWVCGICCEVSSSRVNCNKCSNDTCGECYIRSFVEGRGVIVCPFCRQRTGQVFPAHMMDNAVTEIRRSLDRGINRLTADK